MKFEIENDKYVINGISETNENDKCKLVWDSDNFINQAFIVIKGLSADEIMLNHSSLRQKIQDCENELLQNKRAVIDGMTVYYVRFSEKIENGGLYIEKMPAFYAVYGCTLDGNSIDTVYYGNRNKSTHINVNIDIEQHNCYDSKKGLFKSKKIYTGYKEIRIKNGIRNLPKFTIYYCIGDKMFFVPKQAVEDGVAFYVLCAENERIEFKSRNSAIEVMQ